MAPSFSTSCWAWKPAKPFWLQLMYMSKICLRTLHLPIDSMDQMLRRDSNFGLRKLISRRRLGKSSVKILFLTWNELFVSKCRASGILTLKFVTHCDPFYWWTGGTQKTSGFVCSFHLCRRRFLIQDLVL